MVLRKFIEIDETTCNGCGECVTACAEGALQIIDGKAKVVNDSFCDGLGACIGECPVDALKIVEKDVAEFDEEAVEAHLKHQVQTETKPKSDVACGCPSMAFNQFNGNIKEEKSSAPTGEVPSELQQWPIQLHLVPPQAPYFKGADLLVAASCSAFSFGNFHQEFIKDKVIVIGCPKLDRTEGYVEKLAGIIRDGGIKSITVARMEVPCCGGLSHIVKQAMELAGKKVPFLEEVISVRGELK